jgi:uncharacterized membrane protein
MRFLPFTVNHYLSFKKLRMIKYASLIYLKTKETYLKHHKVAVPFLLLVICGLGVFLRIIYVHHSFWLDELATAWTVKGSFSEILTRCWISNLSPLYYILIYISKVLFGYSEASLRIPGLLAGVLSIPLIYLVTYKLSGSKTLSLLAAFFSSIDPAFIYYSLEVRPYPLIIFFSLLHLYIFLFFLQNKKSLLYALVLGLLSGLIILLHYTAAIICIAELCIAIIYFLKKKIIKQKIPGLLIYILIPCVILLPFVTHIKYLLENNAILGSFINMKELISIFDLHPHLVTYILFPLMISLFFWICSPKMNSRVNKNKRFSLFFLLSWYFIPLLVHWFLTEIKVATIYYPRYLAWIIPAPIIGSAILIGIFQSKWIKLVFIITLLLLTTKSYILSAVTNNLSGKDTHKSLESKLTAHVDSFGWKEAVCQINNSGIAAGKIYVLSGLVESRMLNTDKRENSLMNNYLLSTVNSMYPLRKEHLDKAEPVNSIEEIPDAMSNYIVVGAKWKTEPFECRSILKGGIKLNPGQSEVLIYYVK